MNGTYIDSESARRADVVRKIITKNDFGDVIDETLQTVYGEHWADIQPMSDQQRFANEQLKLQATHMVFPETDAVVDAVDVNDFYRDVADSIQYRIIEPNDFRSLGYFKVWQGDFGKEPTTPHIKRAHFVAGLGDGSYTFGSGSLSSVPAFNIAPCVFAAMSSDRMFFVENVTASGFAITDALFGSDEVSADTFILENRGVVEDGIWCKTGITTGLHTFGSGDFSDISGLTQAPLVIVQPNTDRQIYIENATSSGFTITETLFGNASALCSVLVRDVDKLPSSWYWITGVSDGAYVFGSGSFSSVPSFSRTPIILTQSLAERQFYLSSKSSIGFTIIDSGVGDGSVSLNILVIEN